MAGVVSVASRGHIAPAAALDCGHRLRPPLVVTAVRCWLWCAPQLRANFVGTEFTVFDAGERSGRNAGRSELGCVGDMAVGCGSWVKVNTDNPKPTGPGGSKAGFIHRSGCLPSLVGMCCPCAALVVIAHYGWQLCGQCEIVLYACAISSGLMHACTCRLCPCISMAERASMHPRPLCSVWRSLWASCVTRCSAWCGSVCFDVFVTSLFVRARCVTYQYNVLGTRGPRKMTGVIPALDASGHSLYNPVNEDDSMLERWVPGKIGAWWGLRHAPMPCNVCVCG